MIRQPTISKLHEMRLSAMPDAFESQCAGPTTYQNLSFEDRFSMLVGREWDKRRSTKLQKLILNAEFRYPNASVSWRVADDVNYDGSMKAVLFLLNSRCNVFLERARLSSSQT